MQSLFFLLFYLAKGSNIVFLSHTQNFVPQTYAIPALAAELGFCSGKGTNGSTGQNWRNSEFLELLTALPLNSDSLNLKGRLTLLVYTINTDWFLYHFAVISQSWAKSWAKISVQKSWLWSPSVCSEWRSLGPQSGNVDELILNTWYFLLLESTQINIFLFYFPEMFIITFPLFYALLKS